MRAILDLSRTTLAGWLQRLRHSERGAAAIEFALVLPAMLPMLLGMTEITYGVNMDRKLVLVSRAVADLTGRVNSVTTSDVNNILNAASAIMQPYNTTGMKMVLTSVGVTTVAGAPVGTVQWSCARGTGATARATASLYTVPAGFENATSFVVAEVTQTYTPMFGWSITGPIPLSQTTAWPVRNAAQVTGPGTCP
jgi:Flp pilus assembly protein TadG